MIKFSLICESGHDFEAWFRNGTDFETQKKRGFLECPACGSSKVKKALMAPNVATSGKTDAVTVTTGNPTQREMMAKIQELARKVRAESQDVGTRFAEEARKIHFGETDPRGIYGKATQEEVSGLLEDGVAVMPLPDLPEEMN